MTDYFDYWATSLVSATLRSTICFVVAYTLLRWMKMRSPRLHRIAWAMVVCQGCILGAGTIAVSMPWATRQSSVEYGESEFSLENIGRVVATREHKIREANLEHSTWDILRQVVVSIWAIGIVFALSRTVWRYRAFFGTVSIGKEPEPSLFSEWSAALNEFPNIGNVQLRITESSGPAVCFLPWCYFVFVPKSMWQDLTSEDRKSILLHELSHIHRMDLWKSVGIRLAAILQWFNPLVWSAVRRFDEAAEWACDDHVRACSASPYDYAKTLLAVGDYLAQPLPLMPSMSGGNMSRRIRRIVTEFKEDSIVKKSALALCLALVTLSSVRVHPVYADENEPQLAEHQGHSQFVNAAPPPLLDKVVGVRIDQDPINLDVGSRRMVRLDVPVVAIRSRNDEVVVATHKEESSIELLAHERGSTEVEVKTPMNGTIVLNVKVLAPEDHVSLHMQVFEINGDKETVQGTLEQLFPSTAKVDGRTYLSVRDEKGLKGKIVATKAKMVAEPTLTTVSGRPAAFHARGEFPVLDPQGLGEVAVEFRQFGTRVDMVPLVLSKQRLRLEIRPSVTALKAAKAGEKHPTTVSRFVDTATEMDFNKVLVLAMVDEDTDSTGKLNCLVTTVQPAIAEMDFEVTPKSTGYRYPQTMVTTRIRQ